MFFTKGLATCFSGKKLDIFSNFSVVLIVLFFGFFLKGLPLQDEVCVCSLPHQRRYSGEWFSCWNPKFWGWKIHPQGLDEARGCLFSNSGQKDELILDGNNIELVSNSAALIQQATIVKKKNIGKFLDGIYVSKKGTVQKVDE